MKLLSKKTGKNGVVAVLIIDIISIVLSNLISQNITNTTLYRIVYFLSCIQHELFMLLLALTLVLFYYFIVRTINKKHGSAFSYFIVLLPLIIALISSYHEAVMFVKARYYYFNNELYNAESQLIPIRNAEKLYQDRDWEKCYAALNNAIKIYPNGYYTFRLQKAADYVSRIIEYENFMYETWILKQDDNPTKESYRCVRLLNDLNPHKYSQLFQSQTLIVRNAIDQYDSLYSAYLLANIDNGKELIKRYGWCWFEPTVQDLLVNSTNDLYKSRLKDLFQEEDAVATKMRLHKLWRVEGAIETGFNE